MHLLSFFNFVRISADLKKVINCIIEVSCVLIPTSKDILKLFSWLVLWLVSLIVRFRHNIIMGQIFFVIHYRVLHFYLINTLIINTHEENKTRVGTVKVGVRDFFFNFVWIGTHHKKVIKLVHSRFFLGPCASYRIYIYA